VTPAAAENIPNDHLLPLKGFIKVSSGKSECKEQQEEHLRLL
jgi:hypothetical protein